jgi:hypothetical protein
MLHPALSRALATARVEDLHRAAAASTRLRGRRVPRADGMTPAETSHAALVGRPIRRRRSLIAGVKPHEDQAGLRRA